MPHERWPSVVSCLGTCGNFWNRTPEVNWGVQKAAYLPAKDFLNEAARSLCNTQDVAPQATGGEA